MKDKARVPVHIAIIMDGNGRWAKSRLLPKKIGHKEGARALNKLLEEINNTDIKHVTVYAFSTENWKRSKEEVNDILGLLKESIAMYIKENDGKNIKIDTIGDISAFDKGLIEDIKKITEISKNNTGVNLHIAINYGGRDEIKRAVKNIAKSVKNGDMDENDIDESLISSFLDTREYKDPELLIRTSGELRLSNFLLWQTAYTELYFSDKLWPDFTYKDLEKILEEYKKRQRRFGGRIEE